MNGRPLVDLRHDVKMERARALMQQWEEEDAEEAAIDLRDQRPSLAVIKANA